MGTYGMKFKKQRHRPTRNSERDQDLKNVPQDDCRFDGDWTLGEAVYRGDI